MKTRALLRAGLIIALTAIPVAIGVVEMLLRWHPRATFGFAANPTGIVRTGDRIALERMPVAR